MKKVLELINNYDGEIYDLCYKFLSEGERHEVVFQYVCENLLQKPDIPKIKIEQCFTKEEIAEYKSLYGDMVDGIIKSTIKQCNYGIIKSTDFYKALWERYSDNMSTLKELSFAFYYTIIDRRIPYIYIGKPLSMDQTRFEELIKKSQEHLKKVQYILDSSYRQKTEAASLILRCIDDIDDYAVKVVVLAKTLDMNNTKKKKSDIDIEDIIQAIDRRIEELESSEG